MINQVALTGRLTQEVDLRYTQGGAAVATFRLAVERRFKNQQGERESDFINCVMWRKSAENFANFTRKGSLVGIEGRIQTRNYEDKDGKRVYVTEVIAENFALLESRNVTESRPQNEPRPAQGGQQAPRDNRTQQPQNGTQGATGGQNTDPYHDPFANSGKQINISDDDLPF